MSTGTHAALRVRGTGGKEDTFVEKATVTFTKHVKHRVSTLYELEALTIAEVREDTDVEGICHFTTIVPKGGNSRPFPIYLATPPLHMCKARVHVCSRAIPRSNGPPTMTVISLQLHCCCPLMLNLNGFDLALEPEPERFQLLGQRHGTFVRCRACSIHKHLHGKSGSPTEGGGSGSSAAGGGGAGGGDGSPKTGADRHGGEGEGSSPAAGINGGGDSGSTAAGGGSGDRSPEAGAGGR